MEQHSVYTNPSQVVLGDLITLFPNGGPLILNQLGIDYCCGGQRRLVNVLEEDKCHDPIEKALSIIHNIEEREKQELEKHNNQDLTPTQQRMDKMNATELVQHIIL